MNLVASVILTSERRGEIRVTKNSRISRETLICMMESIERMLSNTKAAYW